MKPLNPWRLVLISVVEVVVLFWLVHALRGDEPKPPPTHLLFCTADWCGACQAVKPIVEKVAKRHKVVTADWDRDQPACKRWGVRLLPTFVMLRRGKEVDRAVGVVSEEKLEAMCQKGKAK